MGDENKKNLLFRSQVFKNFYLSRVEFIKMTVKSNVIKIDKLVKRYPKAHRDTLNNLEFSVAEGEFFGLLGPNGSGKTTLISILCGLMLPTSGYAEVFGQNVATNFAKISRSIGLVPQEIALYPSLTLLENLQFLGRLYGLSRSQLKNKIEECVTISQLDKFCDKPIQTYSGGMKKRANLVASLIHEPKLLFLDEPTANVDPQSRNMIFENLIKLREAGITMFYTTHYMEEAERLCSLVGIMDEGQLILKGSPQELIKKFPECNDLGEVFLHLTGKNLRDF